MTTIEALPWVFDDGGRVEAGYRGFTGDCGVRALAIATDLSYREAYDLANTYGAAERTRKSKRTGADRKKSGARTGIYGPTMRRIMADLGWVWVPTMFIGSGTTVHLRVGELPTDRGPLITNLSKHFAAVVDGKVHDIYDPTRDGTRAVYGFYHSAGTIPVGS